MKITEIQLSLFKPYYIEAKGCWVQGTKPESIDLGFALGFNHQPELLEAIRHEEDPTQLRALKAGLWMITPSALMAHGRKSSNVVVHTGLMQFDIDHVDGRIGEYFNFIKAIPYVLYLGVSASGKGLWGLMRIAYPEKHAQQFDAMAKGFADVNIDIDKAPRAVNSARYLSYDAGHYFNPGAVTFDKVLEPVKAVKKRLESKSSNDGDGKVLIKWFNDYCTAENMDEILTNFGFQYHSRKGTRYRYTRPDKETRAGLSVDYCELRRTLFSFSDQVPMLEKWKREDNSNGWSCSPLTALLLYGCGGYDRQHWKTAFEYIKSIK